MSDSINETEALRRVMKAIYNLSDEDNYNVYDADDISEYLGLERLHVDRAIGTLYIGGCLSECMRAEDDGIETFVLTDKAIDMVELG